MTRLVADASGEIPGGDLDLDATAAQALRLAALDPAGARALVASVVDQARRAGAWNAVSSAEREGLKNGRPCT